MNKISVIIPVYNVREYRFRKTLESVVCQSYQNFEICISDASHKDKSVKNIAEEYRNKGYDIKYRFSDKKLGISENTNAALELSTGDIIALLDHDDLLSGNAFSEVIRAYTENSCDVTYSDEQIVDDNGTVLNYFYKPDFSPDLLYSQNYICHLLTFKREIYDEVGPFRSEYDGAQDYDYILRIYEKTGKIYHIDEILYSWLSTEESTSTNTDSKPYAQSAGLNALDAHLKRKYGKIASAAETDNLFVYKAVFNTLKSQKIGIIIPMKDKYYLTEQCVYSIIKYTKYQNYEILILDNNSEEKITLDWFEDVVKRDDRIKVLKADMEFNWSKLQNYGIKNCDADCYVFLNNDIIVEDGNWLEVLCSNALREEVGVVGPLLLYEDNTIQHGGVVIGLCGYADHLYKGMKPVHAGVNFISPMVARNVLAVTGACMAISKATLKKIGGFDENFIICGSDVEICIRAYEQGLRNIYTPNTYLKHLESKTRDTFIPEVDFELSKMCYEKYWNSGDPFFNKNLSLGSLVPSVEVPAVVESKLTVKQIIKKILKKIINFLRKVPVLNRVLSGMKQNLKKNETVVRVYRKIRHIPYTTEGDIIVDYRVPECSKDIKPRKCSLPYAKRINILIPTLNKDKVYGGIATAMKFFNLIETEGLAKRIVIVDTGINEGDLDSYHKYVNVNCRENSEAEFQVVDIHDPGCCELEVDKNDIFLATAWWTAYIIRPVIKWQAAAYAQECKDLLYFIQDYEPIFYPFGSRYVLSESTYRFDVPVTAIFNSTELKEYMINRGYKFSAVYSFDPILNDRLKKHLLEDKELPRKKRIIVYGRPGVPRNAFEIICAALITAFKDREDANEWEFVSMGEQHYDVIIKDDVKLKSVGKLSLDGYARMMEESYMGISLMISPHPSYPPLEMSSFGVKTITNAFANKDLGSFNENIYSVAFCDPELIAGKITELVDNYTPDSKIAINEQYLNNENQMEGIIAEMFPDKG